jgi:hypothetical protein
VRKRNSILLILLVLALIAVSAYFVVSGGFCAGKPERASSEAIQIPEPPPQ